MKYYELMYIVDPAAEDGVDAVKQKIEGIITGREGSVTSYERLGKKRLAYLITKRQFGVYYLVNFHGEGRIIHALEQFLLLSPIVLRHIVLAFTEKDLKLRVETERILLEEAERMRMGGKPLRGATESDERVKVPIAPVKAKQEVVETPAETQEASDPIAPVESEPVADEEKKDEESPVPPSEEIPDESGEKSNE